MISKFNGTSTPKGSSSAKTGVNYPMSPNRVHQKIMPCSNECKVQGKMSSHILKNKRLRGLDTLLGHLLDKRISVRYKLTTIVTVTISLKI